MKKEILDILQLIIELKNDDRIPKKYEKELERSITYLKKILEDKSFNLKKADKSIIAFLAALLFEYFRTQ